jgi:hypothetical protein
MLLKKCIGQYKGNLQVHCLAFDAVYSRVSLLINKVKMQRGEREQHLDGCPLHVTNGGCVVTLVFVRGLLQFESLRSLGS